MSNENTKEINYAQQGWVNVDTVLSALKTYDEIKNNEKVMELARLVTHLANWVNVELNKTEAIAEEIAAKKNPDGNIPIEYVEEFVISCFCKATALEILQKFEKLNIWTFEISKELKHSKDVIFKLTEKKYPGWKKSLGVLTCKEEKSKPLDNK